MKIITGILLLPLLAACTFTKTHEPMPPITELSGDSCVIRYGDNTYKATITHMFEGVTSITFAEPKAVEGIVYTFSDGGCNIIFDDLKFSTERSFMSCTSLPQLICDIMDSAQGDEALTYKERSVPESSTLTTAIYTGRTKRFPYTLTTDFDSGYIKEISADSCNLTVTFSGR